MTSDLHSHSFSVFDDLENEINLIDYDVYTVGDMAGDMIYGSDGDATPLYNMLKEKVNHLYIIQGNHDLPPENEDTLLQMKNSDGTKVYLSDGFDLQQTANGKVGCVHGIISHNNNKQKPYRKQIDHFNILVKNILAQKPDFFFTHETPELSYVNLDQKRIKFIGKDTLFAMVGKAKCKVHVYGHCHHPNVMTYIGQTLYVNVDARILIMEPTK